MLILVDSSKATFCRGRHPSNQNEARWAEALAFDHEHGTHGPDVLAARIHDLRSVGNERAALHWFEVGHKLIELHLAGAGRIH